MARKEAAQVRKKTAKTRIRREAALSVSGPGVVSVSAESVLGSKIGQRQIAALSRLAEKSASDSEG